MGKRTGQTDFGEIAELRLNKLLDFSKIHSKAEYIEALKQVLRSTPSNSRDSMARNASVGENLLPYVEELYEESNAKEKIRDNNEKELDALRRAQILESKRPRKSRELDERHNHKITRRANNRTVARWRRGKYRTMDIKDVDTKRTQISLNTKNLITRRDIRLKNIGVIMDKRGIKHYTDKKTGRYTSNPFKNQKV